MRVILCLALFFYSAFALSFQNEPDGFRGIEWGAPIAENIEEMVYVKTNAGIDVYTRKNSKMSIGDALLAELTYGYSLGKFLVVYIKPLDKNNSLLLHKQFAKQFGEKPWAGEAGTVLASNERASIYSTQLMREQFQIIERESKQLMKRLNKKYNVEDSDF